MELENQQYARGEEQPIQPAAETNPFNEDLQEQPQNPPAATCTKQWNPFM